MCTEPNRLWLRRLWWFHFLPRPHNSLAALVSCVVHKKGVGSALSFREKFREKMVAARSYDVLCVSH